MIPNPPHRTKGGAPLLGARRVGAPGPFGRWPAEGAEPEPDEPDDALGDDGGVIFADRRKSLVDEPEPEPTSHVEQQVQARVQAARVRIAAAKERRASLAEARKAGLAHRHAQRLRNLRDAEQRRLEAQGD